MQAWTLRKSNIALLAKSTCPYIGLQLLYDRRHAPHAPPLRCASRSWQAVWSCCQQFGVPLRPCVWAVRAMLTLWFCCGLASAHGSHGRFKGVMV